MSSAVKTIFAVIVLIVVAGGIYWYVKNMKPAPAPTETVTQEPAPVVIDTSDDAIDATASALDGMMSALDADISNVDESLKDTPVSQTY